MTVLLNQFLVLMLLVSVVSINNLLILSLPLTVITARFIELKYALFLILLLASVL